VLRAVHNGIDNAVAVLEPLSSDTLQTLRLWMDVKGMSAIEPM
jgi:hypothetical protein